MEELQLGGFQTSNVGEGSYSARSNRPRKIKYSVLDSEQDKLDDMNEVKKKKKKPLKVNTDVSMMDSSSKSTLLLLPAQQIQSLTNSGKRPRGRPPLSTKRQNIAVSHNGSNGSIPSQYNQFSSNQSHQIASSGNRTLNNCQEAVEQVKQPRPPYKVVADKVVSKLMVSDPISLSDLTKKLVDCPRDMIQAVLDILQVLGVVVQHKAKDNLKAEYPSGVAVFSLIHFVKTPYPVGLHELHDDIIKKSSQIQRVDSRLKQLEELGEKMICRDTKRVELSNLLQKFYQNDPELVENPVYRSVFESLPQDAYEQCAAHA